MADSTTENPETANEVQYNPDYLVWKKNAPYLYNLLVTASLPWPSLTIEWFPAVEDTPQQAVQNLLLGTRTLGQGPEYLRIGKLTLPKSSFSSLDKYDPEQGTIGGHLPQKRDIGFEMIQKIDHEGEVNRARYMPQNQNIIATIASTGQVSVFDSTHYPFNPIGVYKPDIHLQGHTAEGFGLAWSKHTEGVLATGANDAKLLIWDITKYESTTGKLSPLVTIEKQTKSINDISWSPSGPNILASVSDDNSLAIVDWRSAALVGAKIDIENGPGVSVEYNPANDSLLAIGTSTGQVQIWDTRKSAGPIHTFNGHTDSCVAVRWNKHAPNLLASGSQDKSVLIWDTSAIGSASKNELVFRHAGHEAPVADVAWNPARPTAIASVADDNSLHIWEPSPDVLALT